MTTEALPLPRAPARPPPLRWVLFVGCAAAFFVLAYTSALTWSQVQEAHRQGFGRELAALTQGVASGNAYRQAAGLGLGVLGALAMLSKRGAAQVRPRGALGWGVLAYLALAVASVAWADDPLISIRRVAAFAFMVVAVAGVVRLLPADAVVSFALFGSAAYVLIAVAAEVATGAFRPADEGYRLSGVFHPNTVATFSVVLLLAATCLPRGTRRALRVALALLAAAVLVLTRSRSSLVATLVVLPLRWLVVAPASRAVLAVALAAWIACAAAFTFGDAVGPAVTGAVLMSRGDSEVETLGGRTALWGQLLGYAAERPLLGHGLGGFWDPGHVTAVYASQRWPAADAHNTYLEQLLDLGAAGLGLFLLVMGTALGRAVRAARAGGGAAAFVLCMVVYFVLEGLLDTLQPSPSFVTFVVFWCVGLLAFRAPADLAGRPRCTST